MSHQSRMATGTIRTTQNRLSWKIVLIRQFWSEGEEIAQFGMVGPHDKISNRKWCSVIAHLRDWRTNHHEWSTVALLSAILLAAKSITYFAILHKSALRWICRMILRLVPSLACNYFSRWSSGARTNWSWGYCRIAHLALEPACRTSRPNRWTRQWLIIKQSQKWTIFIDTIETSHERTYSVLQSSSNCERIMNLITLTIKRILRRIEKMRVKRFFQNHLQHDAGRKSLCGASQWRGESRCPTWRLALSECLQNVLKCYLR